MFQCPVCEAKLAIDAPGLPPCGIDITDWKLVEVAMELVAMHSFKEGQKMIFDKDQPTLPGSDPCLDR